MITCEALRRNRAAFRSLTGYTPEQFDALFADFAPAHSRRCQASTSTKKEGTPRQRAVGGGPRYHHDLQTRLLIALFWLRIYPTFEVLAFFFSLNKTNVHDTVNDMLATLATLAHFPFERPAAERKKLRSAAAVMDAFPEVRLVIDAKEQRIQRPKSSKEEDRQQPYYSGKKKCHTLKNQVAVEPDGRLGAVSASVPGGGIHDLVLLRMTRLMERLSPEEAAMMDKGYHGLGKYYPEHRIYQPIKAQKKQPLTEEEKAYNREIARYRIVVEHTNAQLNPYEVLSQRYRHELRSHSRVVRAVAYLVDRRIRERPLKSYSVA